MNDLGVSLRIKYKTETVPNSEQITNWLRRVEALKSAGVSEENAGALAAKEFFDVNPNLVLKAEADTIDVLLQRAREVVSNDRNE